MRFGNDTHDEARAAQNEAKAAHKRTLDEIEEPQSTQRHKVASLRRSGMNAMTENSSVSVTVTSHGGMGAGKVQKQINIQKNTVMRQLWLDVERR